MVERDTTTITLPRSLKDRLDDAKAYPSMTYADLFRDMLGAYETPTVVADGGER